MSLIIECPLPIIYTQCLVKSVTRCHLKLSLDKLFDKQINDQLFNEIYIMNDGSNKSYSLNTIKSVDSYYYRNRPGKGCKIGTIQRVKTLNSF